MGREHIKRSNDGKGTTNQTGKWRNRKRYTNPSHKTNFINRNKSISKRSSDGRPVPNFEIVEVNWNPSNSMGYPDTTHEYVKIRNVDTQCWNLYGFSFTTESETGNEYTRIRWDESWTSLGCNGCGMADVPSTCNYDWFDVPSQGYFPAKWDVQPGAEILLVSDKNTYSQNTHCSNMFSWNPYSGTCASDFNLSNYGMKLRLYSSFGASLLDEVFYCAGSTEWCGFQSPGESGGPIPHSSAKYNGPIDGDNYEVTLVGGWIDNEETTGDLETGWYDGSGGSYCSHTNCGPFTNLPKSCQDTSVSTEWGILGEYCPLANNKAIRDGNTLNYCNRHYACGYRGCSDECGHLEYHCVYNPWGPAPTCNKCDPSYHITDCYGNATGVNPLPPAEQKPGEFGRYNCINGSCVSDPYGLWYNIDQCKLQCQSGVRTLDQPEKNQIPNVVYKKGGKIINPNKRRK